MLRVLVVHSGSMQSTNYNNVGTRGWAELNHYLFFDTYFITSCTSSIISS